MFIRENKTFNKKSKTEYVTHRLVESYKTEKGPRQRIIMHLGVLEIPRQQWRHLAAILEARLAGQESLVEDNDELSNIANRLLKRSNFVSAQKVEQQQRVDTKEAMMIDAQSVEPAFSRSLGAELVGHSFWEKLGFAQMLAGCGLNERQIALAEAVILGRLISPGSDLQTWRWFGQESALPELTSKELHGVGKDSFYEIADTLYIHKERIEAELSQREASLFSLGHTVILYDLTNTYLEGNAHSNSLAKRGKCKSHRCDCPLVTLALAVDQFGFPVFSHIYGGNQSEPETLEAVLNRLQDESYGLFSHTLRPTVIMDRGIATKDNLELLKKRQYPYTVIERRPVEKEYESEFLQAKDTFELLEETREGRRDKTIYVKKVNEGSISRVLVYSEGRKQKEAAIDALKETRFCEDLERLCQSVRKGNISLVQKVAERLGRIKTKYGSIQRHYEVELQFTEDMKKVQDISWSKKPSREQRALLTGCYVIETTHQELSASEIWRQYMTLSQVESSFRDLKTDLGLRPIYHQNAERTKAHLFIAVLAYHLLVSIEHTLQKQGDHREWRTIRAILKTHQRTTIIITGMDGTIYHLRVSGVPETEHARIFKILDVKNPLNRAKQVMGVRK